MKLIIPRLIQTCEKQVEVKKPAKTKSKLPPNFSIPTKERCIFCNLFLQFRFNPKHEIDELFCPEHGILGAKDKKIQYKNDPMFGVQYPAIAFPPNVRYGRDQWYGAAGYDV